MLPPDLRTLIRQGDELEDHFDALSDGSPELEKCVADIRTWLGLCVDYGRFLPDPSPDRRALQGRVDYWTSVLSQRGHPLLDIDRVADFDPQAGSPLVVKFPYPGLTAYDAKDRAVFSGREREADQSVAHLERNRALLLVSESGGGKSSLALASILPKLKDAHPDWLFAPSMTPGAHPIGALSRTLRTRFPQLPADFIQPLASDPQSEELAGVVAQPVFEALSGRCLILFIDQLEELLTLCNDSRRQAAFSHLLSALGGAGNNVRVLATMRLDHQNQFATSQACRALYRLLASRGGVKTLEPLNFDEIRSAIRKPAEAVGLRFVPPEIVDKLAQQTANLVGGLPLLQFALWRLWETRPKRNESALDLINDQQLAELPSVLGALGTVAEALYKQLPAPMGAACERMMLELTIPAENYQEPLRRRRREREVVDLLVRHTQVDERQAGELIDALAKARLVVRTGEGEDAQLEVAHEAIFRNWERFRTWVSGDETKARLQALRQLGREAAQWADSERSVDYLKQKGEPLQRASAYLRDGWLDEASREYVEHCEREEHRRIRQIEKARRTQGIMRKLSGAVVLFLLVAFVGWLGWRFWFGPEIKVAWLKSLPPEEKGRRAETVLNTVAADLLDIGAIERLAKLLEGARDIQYEVSDWAERERTIATMGLRESTGISPITLEHNQAHGAHPHQIRYYWSVYAPSWLRDLIAQGIPIPATLDLKEANGADALSVRAAAAKPAEASIASTKTRRRLSTLGTPWASSDRALTDDRICDPCDLDVPSTKDKVVISAAQLPDSLGTFFDKHKGQWTRLDTAVEGESRWLVPRWTLPLWHASNVEVWPGEAAFVLAIGKTLHDRPELALSADTVKYLLQREVISYPKTVAEARNMRDGDERIRSVLVESLKAGQVNDHFPDLLDTITDNPNKSAPDIVKQGPDAPVTVDNLTGPSKPLGNEKTSAGVFAQEDTEIQPQSDLEAIFGKSADSLPMTALPVRVYLGPALVDSLVRNRQLSNETLGSLAEIRGELYKRFGITVPGVRFTPAEPVSSEKAFRIEVLREVSTPENTASEPEHVLNKIKDRLAATRAKWLSAEATAQLVNELPAAVYEWLYARYSLTDLKRILRAVMSPIQLEPKGSPQVPEQPLSYAPWLLRSLVFWTSYCKPLDGHCLVNGLRKTQAARLGGPTEEGFTSGTLADRVNRAIKPLISGDSGAAASLFEEALKSDGGSDHTDKAFVALYARYAREVQRRHLEELCPVPVAGRSWGKPEAAMETSYQLEEFLGTAGDPRNGEVWPELELCLFWNYVGADSEGLRKKAPEQLERLVKLQTMGQWTEDTRYWAGYELLRSYKPGKSDPEDLELARELLAQALRNYKDAARAEEVFSGLAMLCDEIKTGNWCWLTLKPLGSLFTESFIIPLQLAFSLSGMSAPEAHEAETWLVHAVTQLSNQPEESAERGWAWLDLAQAQIYLKLAVSDEAWDQTKARGLITKTIDLVTQQEEKDLWPALADLYKLLGDTSFYKAKPDDPSYAAVIKDAIKDIDKGLQLFEDDPGLNQARLFYLMAADDIEGAATFAREYLKKYSGEKYSAGVGFAAALALFLAKGPDFKTEAARFLQTEHEYTDYVRLLLFALHLEEGDRGAARLVLKDRVEDTKCEASTQQMGAWIQRMKDGDLGAWRELLLKYYWDETFCASALRSSADQDSQRDELIKSSTSPQALRAEAYWYEALLKWAKGDTTGEKTFLQQATANGGRDTFEYHMARHRLSELNR